MSTESIANELPLWAQILVAALVLGAAAGGAPGMLVAHFTGTDAGALPVPVMIIPGSLTREAIDRLS